MTRKKRSYTIEFKQDSVSLINEIGVSKASDQLGVSKSTLQSWLNKNIIATNPKEDVDWKTEAKRFKKENGYLKAINEVLKKHRNFIPGRSSAFKIIMLLSRKVSVLFLCNFFKVSCSGFYSWKKRSISKRGKVNIKAKGHVVKAFKALKGRYGSPRLAHYLRNNGLRISENTVAKIIKKEGLIARKRRKLKALSSEENIFKNTSKRIFKIEGNNNHKVNEVWVGDITYIPFNNNFLYLSVVMDLKRRKIVGWSLDLSLSSRGALNALESAKKKEGRVCSVFHYDQGVQYKSFKIKDYLKRNSIVQSMSRKGNCYDNAFMESFFKSLKIELSLTAA